MGEVRLDGYPRKQWGKKGLKQYKQNRSITQLSSLESFVLHPEDQGLSAVAAPHLFVALFECNFFTGNPSLLAFVIWII